MFSSRLPRDLQPNRLAGLVEAKRGAGASLLDLTESNPTRAGFSYPSEEIVRAFTAGKSLVYEPAPTGLAEARAAVAGYYVERGQPADPERILLTASTSEAYAYLFKLLADPGGEVLVPRPSYPLFEFLAAMEGVRIAQYPLVYHDGWSIDLDALARAAVSRTRAVIVVNPNNPTGSFIKREELETLVRFCATRDLAIISDEVFADYAFGPDPRRVRSLCGVEEALTFCLSGLSKVAGLPQVKLAWIVMGGPAAARAQAAERLELIADTYLSVGTHVQHAAPRLLAVAPSLQEQIARRLGDNLEFLQSAVRSKSGCRLLAVEGGWCAVLEVPTRRSEEEWCLEILDKDDVLVQPGFFYDFDSEAFLVLSLLTGSETFREGVLRLLKRLEAP